MKIAVVGAAGFLGSELCKRLVASGVTLSKLDKNSSEENSINFCDVENCAENGGFSNCDAIINLAAEHKDNVVPSRRYYDVNVRGAEQICEAATKNDISTIVFTSSVAVYGFAPPGTNETGETNHFNEYGRTKLLAEQVYRRWQSEDLESRSLLILRPTVIFGPGNRGNVYNLLRQIANRRFVMFGHGQNVKSMAYVENVAEFMVMHTDMGPGVHIFNYVDVPDLSMDELVKLVRNFLFNKSDVGLRLPSFVGVFIGKIFDAIAWLARKQLSISSIRVKKFMATTQFSSAVAKTGFKAPYTLTEGLEKTLRYEFLEDNRNKPTYDTE